MTEIAYFSGSALPAPWGANGTSLGSTSFSYSGATTTATDSANLVTTSVTDALGRLHSVDQGAGSSAVYQYNQFNSVTQVTQTDSSNYGALGSPSITQTRTFAYSSLDRLTSAANPESTFSYQYCSGGSLKGKTDARGASVTYAIDGLKRVLSKTYAGITTPNVTYCYDGQMYLNGACTAGTRGGGAETDYPKGRLTGYGSQVDGVDAAQN